MLSIVIPARNEVDSLEPLHREIDAVLEASALQAEIIFVDDGSTDGTWSRIVALADRDARVRGIRFRRNFGKAAALSAAFSSVRGDLVITLDADLQDDPASIPLLVHKLEEGFDLVSAWRRERFDPWHKRVPSLLFNWLVGIFSGLRLHDHNCGLKGYRSEVVKEIRLFGELHRFITLLAHRSGFRVTEIETRHRPRLYG
ncbi:MAG: glycosyltransferase family 2 protein, partial [Acidobacteriota bacterium]|nr:glycosyltransferase family 2 protein [Acidobacteriota bacterium]